MKQFTKHFGLFITVNNHPPNITDIVIVSPDQIGPKISFPSPHNPGKL